MVNKPKIQGEKPLKVRRLLLLLLQDFFLRRNFRHLLVWHAVRLPGCPGSSSGPSARLRPPSSADRWQSGSRVPPTPASPSSWRPSSTRWLCWGGWVMGPNLLESLDKGFLDPKCTWSWVMPPFITENNGKHPRQSCLHFSSSIPQVVVAWTWGGGWLYNIFDVGIMDFAGSGIVHLTGGVAGLAGAVSGGLVSTYWKSEK